VIVLVQYRSFILSGNRVAGMEDALGGVAIKCNPRRLLSSWSKVCGAVSGKKESLLSVMQLSVDRTGPEELCTVVRAQSAS
jgi:hypothetical protein